jgi:hypothetical protein
VKNLDNKVECLVDENIQALANLNLKLIEGMKSDPSMVKADLVKEVRENAQALHNFTRL